MRYNRIILLITATALSVIGCGGSSDNSTLKAGELPALAGAWQVAFNILVDECGLTEDGASAFDDTHTIAQRGDEIEVETTALPNGFYIGSLRGTDSFTAEASLEGEIFGDGIFCKLIEQLSYNNITSDSAETVYRAQISCADGFVCESAVRGRADRLHQ